MVDIQISGPQRSGTFTNFLSDTRQNAEIYCIRERVALGQAECAACGLVAELDSFAAAVLVK